MLSAARAIGLRTAATTVHTPVTCWEREEVRPRSPGNLLALKTPALPNPTRLLNPDL